jgi:pyruvate,water dikinase
MRDAWAALGAAGLPTAPFWEAGIDGYVRLNASNLAAASRALYGAAWLGPVRGEVPSGIAARLRVPGVIRRAEAEIQCVQAAMPSLHARLFDWHHWVRGLRWTQADILQVMEELEPNAQAALRAYFTLRAGLEAAHARLANAVAPARDPARGAGLIAGLAGLPSVEAVYALARCGSADPAYEDFLFRYGHRGACDVTPAAVRWRDHPERLRVAIGTGATREVSTAQPSRDSVGNALLGSLDSRSAREAGAALEAASGLARAADMAWDSIALVMAAAQYWIGAAAAEAAEAGLIGDAADVLLLELEELKQVATGEWHGGKRDEVEAQVKRRRLQMLGPSEPVSPTQAQPAGGGRAEGAALRMGPGQSIAPRAHSILTAQNPDAGWTDHWMTASGLISAATDPCSPGMIVARVLGLPSVIGAADFVSRAATGMLVSVDGDTGRVIAR